MRIPYWPNSSLSFVIFRSRIAILYKNTVVGYHGNLSANTPINGVVLFCARLITMHRMAKKPIDDLIDAHVWMSRDREVTDEDLAASVTEFATLEPMSGAWLDAMHALEVKLGAEAEFVGPPRQIRNANGAHHFSANFVAQRMLQIARTADGATAVAWFRKVRSINRGTGGAVKALYGVKCSERIALSHEVALVPFLELPSSTMRDYVQSQYNNQAALGTYGFRGFILPPLAALYRAGTIEPLDANELEDYATTEPATWFAELDAAALLLALIPKAIPLEAVHWVHYDDPDVAMLCQFGISWKGSDFRPGIFEPPEITGQLVTGLLSSYRALKKGDKDRVTLALHRIIRSRSQTHPGDRAIDLSIALEVLFMKTDSGEHSYKNSLRCARLVRTSLGDRRTIFAQVRKLYDMRSDMVHKGSTDNVWTLNGVKVSARDLVESVDVVCTESIRRFLLLGSIPQEWRDIELG